jgi:cysteine desulfurase/selenocysteine lyase
LVVDAAQAAPHRRSDVQKLDCDFLAFSSHKLCGPTGVGVLWGRAELLERMSPFNFGGEMIRKVTIGNTTWNDLPCKLEAGTPPISEAVGMGPAINYLTEIGMEPIEEHALAAYRARRGGRAGVHVFGPVGCKRPERRRRERLPRLTAPPTRRVARRLFRDNQRRLRPGQ